MGTFSGASAGTYNAGQSYMHTIQAFELYFSRLSEQGFLLLEDWVQNPPRYSIKLLLTAAEALANKGYDVADHLIMIRGWSTVVIIVSRKPVSREMTAEVRSFCESMQFDLVYVPGIKEEETNRFNRLDTPLYYRAARDAASSNRRSMIERGPLDYSPPTDTMPFFLHFLNPLRTTVLIRKFGLRWTVAIEYPFMLAVFLLVTVSAVSAVCVCIPAGIFKFIRRKSPPPEFGTAAGYFFFIGIAYLFMEFVAIQRAEFVFRDRSIAPALVIILFLAASGAGSFASDRSWFSKRWIHICLLTIISVIGAGMLFVFSSPAMLKFHWFVGTVWMGFLCVVPAFFMGFWFPSGVQTLRGGELLPWAWAFNGCGSVLSMVLARLISIEWGEHTTVLTAGFCYAIALTCRRGLERNYRGKRCDIPHTFSEGSE